MSPERRKRLPKRPKMSVQKKHEKKGRFGSSRTAFGTAGWQNLKPPWVHRGPKSAGKAVQAGRVLTTPAAIHRRPLETRDWGQIGRALANEENRREQRPAIGGRLGLCGLWQNRRAVASESTPKSWEIGLGGSQTRP